MATIQTLASGASQDVTFTYTIKESDIGKTDLKQTVTASSDTATIQASSPAINIEAVRKTITVTVTRANNPADGSAYAKGEAATFNIAVKNTGNQTLTNVVVSAVTSGATVSNGTISSLGIGATSTVTGSYTIQQSDLGSTNLAITFKATSGTVTAQGASPVLPIKKAFPENEAEFAALSWAEIKEFADQCVADKSKFTSWVGWSKSVDAGAYGTTEMRLVALNNKTKTDGGTAGFTFQSEGDTGAYETMYNSEAQTNLWKNSLVRTLLNGKYYEALPSDLKNVIAEVNNKCATSMPIAMDYGEPGGASIGDIADKCWIASVRELYGASTSGQMYVTTQAQMKTSLAEGTQFDYYVGDTNNAKKNRSTEWWTRSPINDFYKTYNHYNFWVVRFNDGRLYSFGSTMKERIVPCFCI